MNRKTFGMIWLLAWLALAAGSAAPAADATPPDALVKTTTEKVLAAIRQNSDQAKLMQLADTEVVPHFDFERMTRLAVGRAWAQATPEQRQALQKEFRELLVRTYTNALAATKNGAATVEMKPLRGQANAAEVTVRTVVSGAGSKPIPIDYQMEKTADGWKVFDVIVDSISLVTNYRDSFAAEVKQSGVDGLITALAEKNKRLGVAAR